MELEKNRKSCVTHKTSTRKYLFTEISARGPVVEEKFAVGNAAPGEATTQIKAPLETLELIPPSLKSPSSHRSGKETKK